MTEKVLRGGDAFCAALLSVSFHVSVLSYILYNLRLSVMVLLFISVLLPIKRKQQQRYMGRKYARSNMLFKSFKLNHVSALILIICSYK